METEKEKEGTGIKKRQDSRSTKDIEGEEEQSIVISEDSDVEKEVRDRSPLIKRRSMIAGESNGGSKKEGVRGRKGKASEEEDDEEMDWEKADSRKRKRIGKDEEKTKIVRMTTKQKEELEGITKNFGSLSVKEVAEVAKKALMEAEGARGISRNIRGTEDRIIKLGIQTGIIGLNELEKRELTGKGKEIIEKEYEEMEKKYMAAEREINELEKGMRKLEREKKELEAERNTWRIRAECLREKERKWIQEREKGWYEEESKEEASRQGPRIKSIEVIKPGYRSLTEGIIKIREEYERKKVTYADKVKDGKEKRGVEMAKNNDREEEKDFPPMNRRIETTEGWMMRRKNGNGKIKMDERTSNTDKDGKPVEQGQGIRQDKEKEKRDREGIKMRKESKVRVGSRSRSGSRSPNLPRTAAVTLECKSDKMSCEEAIKRAGKEVDLEELGIVDSRMRETMTGGIIVEIPGENNAEKADKLAGRLREVFWNQEDVRIGRPKRMAELLIMGMDMTVEVEEVAERIVKDGECSREEVRIGKIRKVRNGSGTVWVQCPLEAAKVIIEKGGRLKIGWTWVSVELLERRPIRCYRCLGVGHIRANCPSGKERAGSCFNCGKEGHKVEECKNRTHCPVCEERGMEASHRAGSRWCPVYPPRRRKEQREDKEVIGEEKEQLGREKKGSEESIVRRQLDKEIEFEEELI